MCVWEREKEGWGKYEGVVVMGTFWHCIVRTLRRKKNRANCLTVEKSINYILFSKTAGRLSWINRKWLADLSNSTVTFTHSLTHSCSPAWFSRCFVALFFILFYHHPHHHLLIKASTSTTWFSILSKSIWHVNFRSIFWQLLNWHSSSFATTE